MTTDQKGPTTMTTTAERHDIVWPTPLDVPPHEPARAWVSDQGRVIWTSQLVLADYPDEVFGVACGTCLRSLPDCEAHQAKPVPHRIEVDLPTATSAAWAIERVNAAGLRGEVDPTAAPDLFDPALVAEAAGITVIAGMEPDGCALAWGWHDVDAFLLAWDEADRAVGCDGLDGQGIDDSLRGLVRCTWARAFMDQGEACFRWRTLREARPTWFERMFRGWRRAMVLVP